MGGDKSVLPAGELGSNAKRAEADRLTPRAVVCGGGISQEEYEDLKSNVHATLGREVAWFKITPEDFLGPGNDNIPASGQGLDSEKIVKVFKDKMAAAGFQ